MTLVVVPSVLDIDQFQVIIRERTMAFKYFYTQNKKKIKSRYLIL